MYSIHLLAAQAGLKSALLDVLVAAQSEGQFLTAVRATVNIEDGDALGQYEIGGIARDEFHALVGGSL